MKPGKFTRAIAGLLSSITSLFAHGTASKAEPTKTKFSKKSQRSADDRVLDVSSLAFTPGLLAKDASEPGQRFPWKKEIVTTVFWIGEKPAQNNPFPLAKVDGLRFAKATASPMRSGKMPDLSAPITGNTFLVTNGQNLT